MTDSECCGKITFSRVQHYGNTNVLRRLLVNLRYYLEWGLLNIGGWIDIAPQSGFDDHAKLKLDYAAGYTDGRIWTGLRKNWVYESGVEYTDVDGGFHEPIIDPIIEIVGSGYVDDDDYEIDYDLGRVIFDSALPSSTTVRASYSAKNVQIYLGDDVPWFQELQLDSWDYSKHFTVDQSGSWFVSGKHRVQLPAIIISSPGGGIKEGYELGDRTAKKCQDVLFTVIAQDQCTRDNLTDLLIVESDKCIPLFNIDQAAAACDIMLYNYTGERDNKIYPELVNRYLWAYTRADNALAFDLDSPMPGLHTGLVRARYCVLFNSL